MRILPKPIAVVLLALSVAPAAAYGPEPPRILLCRGVLSFGDALARSVRMRLNLVDGTITTAACRTYPHLARFCTGSLIRIADHQFRFGGATSLENTRLLADLVRPNAWLTGTNDAPLEPLRVLFVGRCMPAR
jgi:hypothetical protein